MGSKLRVNIAKSAAFRLVRGTPLLAVLWGLPVAVAQTEHSPVAAIPAGFGVSNLSAYSSYYSPQPFLSGGSDYDLSWGGTATLSWNWAHPRSSFLVTYTPSYTHDATDSALNALSHRMSLIGRHNFTPAWSFTASLGGEVLNEAEFLFRPNLFSQVTESVSSPDELATAILSGVAPDDTHLAALLTGAPILESPARQVFFGNRVLNASLEAAVTRRKGRTHVTFSGGGMRIQGLPGSSRASGTETSLVPSITTYRAAVDASYSLSPRTQVGFTSSTERLVSRFYDAYATSPAVTFGRRMSERWFLELHGGAGFFSSQRSTSPVPRGAQYVGGGTLGLKTHTQAFLVSSGRSLSNGYGIGASSTINTTGSWNWDRPDSGWRLFASGSYQQLRSNGYQPFDAWVGNVGFSRRLSSKTSMSCTYARLQVNARFTGLPGNGSTNALRVALFWDPHFNGN